MKLADKTRLLVTGLLFLSTLIVAGVVFFGMVGITAEFEEESFETHGSHVVKLVETAFIELEHDIRLLEGLSDAKRVVQQRDREASSAQASPQRAALTDVFRQMLIANPWYTQVRLIGVEDGGRELVRVDRSNGSIEVASSENLQRKGGRDYFTGAMAAEPNATFYSKINLNREFGKIQVPHVATLRAARKVHDEAGEVRGLVAINVDFSVMIEALIGDELRSYDVFLTDHAGYYLFHRDKSRTFGFDLGKETLAQSDIPETGWFYGSSAPSLTLRDGGMLSAPTNLIHLQRFQPFGDDRSLVLGMRRSFQDVRSASRSLGVIVLAIVITLVVVAVTLTLILSRELTKPLEKIAVASQHLQEGTIAVELPVSREDEIGVLARKFDEMRRAVVEQQQRIQEMNVKLLESNQDLEHFAHIASHELREPLSRLALLAEMFQEDLEESDADGIDMEPLARMQRASRTALQQITDFRILAGISDGDIVREETCVQQTVRSVILDLDDRIKQQAVTLVWDDLPKANVYPNLLAIVYRNLIDHAISRAQFSPLLIRFTARTANGEMVLGVWCEGERFGEPEAGEQEAGEPEAGEQEAGEQGAGDLGTGEFEHKPPAQEPIETEQGGVTLSICQRIVDRHAGQIWIERHSRTTHFRFKLEVENDVRTRVDATVALSQQ